PRFTFRLNVAKYTWIKGGVGHFSQDPQPPEYHRAFGNPDVRPENAIHYALTLEQGIAPELMLEVTGLYKQLYDLLAPTDAFHQLDIRIDKTFLFKRWVLKAYLDIINVYNQANPELNQSSYDFTRNRPLTGLPIIPSFGIRGEF